MFEDKVLKFNRAEGFYKKDAQLGNVDGAYKNFVARAKVQRSEMDNFNTPDLDQGADSILRPGETLEDDFDVTFRRPNAEGGRQGFNKGLNVKPYLDQEQFVKEFTTQRIDGNKTTTEFVKYLNENYKPSAQTDKFKIGNVDRRMRVLQEKGLIPTDIVTKGSKANLALTPEKYISLLGEKGYAEVKDNPTLLKSRYEYAREKKNNPNFLDQRKIRRQKWVDSLTPEQYREKVTIPALKLKQEKFPTKFSVNREQARSLAWKDLVSRTYEYDISQKKSKGTPYFKFETPLEKSKNHNTADMKNLVLIDKNGNRFTYDTLFDDVKKIAGETEANNFKNTYEQRALMNKTGITTELNKLYGNQPGSYKSVFNVQHIEGFNKNPFKVHMTFATQNSDENKFRRIFTEQFAKASKIPLDGKGNKGARFLAQKAAVNNYYKSLGPDIVAQISKKPQGEAKPLMELLKKTGIKLTDSQTAGVTNLDDMTKKLEADLVALCPRKGKSSGGRIGFNLGSGAACGAKFLEEKLKDGKGTKVERRLMADIVSKGAGIKNFLKGALNPLELLNPKNIIGPQAIALMGAYEAGAVTYDVINNNKPIKEALGDNWILKYASPYNKQEEQVKALEAKNISGSPAMQTYMEKIKLQAEFEREFKKLEKLKKDTPSKNNPKVQERIKEQQAVVDNLKNNWEQFVADKTVDVNGEKVLTLESGKQDFEKAFGQVIDKRQGGEFVAGDKNQSLMKTYIEGKSEDKYINTAGDLANSGDLSHITGQHPYKYKMNLGNDQGRNLSETEREAQKLFPFEKGSLRADYTKPTYEDFNYKPQKLPTELRQDYEKWATEQGVLDPSYPMKSSLSQLPMQDGSNFLETLTKNYNVSQKAKQASMYPGYDGTQEPAKYATGGLAGLMKKYYD